MFHTENQYKMLQDEIKKLRKENELTKKENKLLIKQNKEKDEIIHDLDKNNYKEKYDTTLSHYNSVFKINENLQIENKDLKKSKRLAKAISDAESKRRKR